NILQAKGGVIIPISRFKSIIAAKCKGSMPNALAAGTNIGANNNIAVLVSINIPIIIKSTFTTSRKVTGESVTPNIKLVKAVAHWPKVNMVLGIAAKAINKHIVALVIALFFVTLHRPSVLFSLNNKG